MVEQRIHHLETIIQNWLNNGAPCNPSLKPYMRSLYPTYRSGIRTPKTDHNRKISQTNKKSTENQSILSNQDLMIQMCEDFLRHNRDLT